MSTIRLDIPQLVKTAQQKHGMRYSNYLRYRMYCTRRIKTIRTALKLTNQYKCVPKRSGKFTVRPISKDDVNDSRVLELLIICAEREWAHAMQLKEEVGDDKLSHKKHHVRSKFRRAIKWAGNLERVAKQESVDPATLLEAKAYMNWITANLHFELQDWEMGKEYYEQSKKVCDFSPSVKFEQSSQEDVEMVDASSSVKQPEEKALKPIPCKPMFFDLAANHLPKGFVMPEK